MPQMRRGVWKDPDDVTAALDSLVQPLVPIGASSLCPLGPRKVREGNELPRGEVLKALRALTRPLNLGDAASSLSLSGIGVCCGPLNTAVVVALMLATSGHLLESFCGLRRTQRMVGRQFAHSRYSALMNTSFPIWIHPIPANSLNVDVIRARFENSFLLPAGRANARRRQQFCVTLRAPLTEA
jgi:hypothetical protein